MFLDSVRLDLPYENEKSIEFPGKKLPNLPCQALAFRERSERWQEPDARLARTQGNPNNIDRVAEYNLLPNVPCFCFDVKNTDESRLEGLALY